MQIGKAGGFQVAFFVFAVFLLTAPLSKYIAHELKLTAEWIDAMARIVQLGFLAVAIFIVERVKPGTISGLLNAIPACRRVETGLFVAAKLFLPFAIVAGIVALQWITGGPLAVEQRFPAETYHSNGEASAFSTVGLVLLFASVAMAPLIEEIAFRGLMYRAWEESWGWLPAMVASSVVFGLFHGWFWSTFIGGIFFVCLYRRTGTLLAPIIAHAVGNTFVWYPLLGQFYIPYPTAPTGDLGTWWFHFACLSVFIWLGPMYLLMASRAHTRDGA